MHLQRRMFLRGPTKMLDVINHMNQTKSNNVLTNKHVCYVIYQRAKVQAYVARVDIFSCKKGRMIFE